MEQQTEIAPIDERRRKLLENLAKARAAAAVARAERKGVAKLRADVEVPPIARKLKRRKKSAKTRLDEAIVQRKAVKKGPPDGWLDGIHHMPDGCPMACRGGICIITMENVCAHPDTNLQAHYLRGDHPEVVERFQAARHELRRLDAERSLKK